MRTRIKICCISSVNEAAVAIELGADAIGLVARMPSGPGPIADELIKEIASSTPPLVGTFLLTSETSAEEIIRHHRRTNTNTVQIVDLPEPGTYEKLKLAMPTVKIVQVIHVTDESSVIMAKELSSMVDALLLDSGNPNLKVKELGGTGRVHNWNLSREIVEKSQCPVILAGGLNPGNVAEAIRQVRPFAVDVCSGLRTDGKLDREKAAAFIKQVRTALE
jgi:phosphoribosylanthranilate isomerase